MQEFEGNIDEMRDNREFIIASLKGLLATQFESEGIIFKEIVLTLIISHPSFREINNWISGL